MNVSRQSNPIKELLALSPLLLLAGMLVLLISGCGSSNNALKQPMTKPVADIPKEILEQATLMDPSVLATISRGNPFESLLASSRPVLPNMPNLANGGGKMAPPPKPPENPFEDITLSGIVKGKKPLAILSRQGVPSKIVHQGDVLTLGDMGYRVQVSSITANDVKLSVLQPPKNLPANYQQTALSLPSLVGYQTKGSKKLAKNKGKTENKSATAATGNGSGQGNPNTKLPEVPQPVQAFLGGNALKKIESNIQGNMPN